MKLFLTTGILAALILLVLPEAAYACDKCFGASGDEATIQAVVMSMAALLAMVGVVWGGIGMFFVNMRRRIKMFEPGDYEVTSLGDIRSIPDDEPGR